MSPRTITTQQEALALANVINPGGQRVNPDGTVVPGIDVFHERNCALVAVASAAFLNDGTQAAAFGGPSPLMIQGNGSIVAYLVGVEDSEQKTFNESFDTKEYEQRISELREQFPGKSFIVHGTGDEGHHWFNITPEGKVFDAQVGLLNDNVIRGQYAHDGLREFDELRIYPVDPSRTGQELLKETQEMHQCLSMINLARSLSRSIDEAHYHVVSDALASTLRPYVEQQEKLGRTDVGVIQNEITPELFNTVCDSLAFEAGEGDVDKGREIVVAALAAKLSVTEDSDMREWLTEANFREAGSAEAGPRVVDVYRGKCPMLDHAMNVVERNMKNDAVQQDRGASSFGR